jgi:hypothetical protein
MEPTTVFLRTETGRAEIREKKNGLTQSERLVLIMIDGVADCGAVKEKLSSLTPERFKRAIQTLSKKELISEIFLQLENQPAEEIDQAVVDRYLHQDAMDPVTIISAYPDEEFEEVEHAGHTSTASSHKAEALAQPFPANPSATPLSAVQPTTLSLVPELTKVVAAPAIDSAHARLADELHEQLALKNQEWKRKQAELHLPPVVASSLTGSRPKPAQTNPGQVVEAASRAGYSRVLDAHWGYWLIGLGCTFIIGFLLVKATAL